MCVAWRHRLAIPVFAVLVLVVRDAQGENEAQLAKLLYPRGNHRAVVEEKAVYPRGNHWAVGHLMGKKSIDEPLGSNESDSGGEQYSAAPEDEEHTQPSRFLQALISALAGPESKREREREIDISLRQQHALEQRKELEEQLERERKQAAKLLLLALNMREGDTS
ncbi:hypothetical protein NFI96_016695 [Prochilodus magdalenae]|nr:hypothetical protein NFI96_016695 [Prochilodus magdalenae]